MFNEKYPGKVVKLKMDKMERKSEEIRTVTTGNKHKERKQEEDKEEEKRIDAPLFIF